MHFNVFNVGRSHFNSSPKSACTPGVHTVHQCQSHIAQTHWTQHSHLPNHISAYLKIAHGVKTVVQSKTWCFKSHWTRLANHPAFLPAPQTIYIFILQPAASALTPRPSVKCPVVVVSLWAQGKSIGSSPAP